MCVDLPWIVIARVSLQSWHLLLCHWCSQRLLPPQSWQSRGLAIMCQPTWIVIARWQRWCPVRRLSLPARQWRHCFQKSWSKNLRRGWAQPWIRGFPKYGDTVVPVRFGTLTLKKTAPPAVKGDRATRIYLYVYIYIYIHTHLYIYIFIYAYTRIYISHIHTHVHSHAYIYTCTYTHTYIYINTHTHTHTYIRTCIYAHTYIHTCTNTYVHTYTYTHMQTHIYIYIHTYTRIFILTFWDQLYGPPRLGLSSDVHLLSKFHIWFNWSVSNFSVC